MLTVSVFQYKIHILLSGYLTTSGWKIKFIYLSPLNTLTITLNKREFCVIQQNVKDFSPNERNEKLNNTKNHFHILFSLPNLHFTCSHKNNSK